MKTAIVMSKEEAMSLPLNKRPICFRLSSEMYHKVWESIGNASHLGDKPEQLSDVAVDLLFAIANEKESFVPEKGVDNPDPNKIKWIKFGDVLPGWGQKIFVKLATSLGPSDYGFFGELTCVYTYAGRQGDFVIESHSVLKKVSPQDMWSYA